MKNFTKFAVDLYVKSVPDVKLWVAFKKENTGSAKLATSLGFEISEEASDNVSLVMIK